jgi:hypothetical protein
MQPSIIPEGDVKSIGEKKAQVWNETNFSSLVHSKNGPQNSESTAVS